MKGVDMGHSEDYIRNKTYELEKQKVEIERDKLKLLADIRDVLIAISGTMLGRLAIDCDTPVKGETFNHCKSAVVETSEQIEKRWSE
jgi:hypothetical protein